MSIHSDSDFKAALDRLSVEQQRAVAARFVDSVSNLSTDPRIRAAITTAGRTDITDVELAVVYQAAKSAAVDSYTQCGKETDWLCQAGHFVAEAAVDCVMPAQRRHNLAWDAAMHARMARTCETIARGEGTNHKEAETQYRVVDELK